MLGPFKAIPNSPLDTDQQIAFRQAAYPLVFAEALMQPNAVELVRQFRDTMKRNAAWVDQTLSKALKGEDLRTYALRIHFCLQQIHHLDRSLKQAEGGGKIDRPRCISAMSVLEGELKGMVYTVQDYLETREAA